MREDQKVIFRPFEEEYGEWLGTNMTGWLWSSCDPVSRGQDLEVCVEFSLTEQDFNHPTFGIENPAFSFSLADLFEHYLANIDCGTQESHRTCKDDTRDIASMLRGFADRIEAACADHDEAYWKRWEEERKR